MPFVANPLALSVPEAAFEAWLRDSGYLETLDTSSSSLPTSSATFPFSSSKPLPPKNPAAAVAGVIYPVFFFLRTLASLFTINPFAKLTPEDFAGETPSWTLRFIGDAGSYSWPGGPSQARMRVQENISDANSAIESDGKFRCLGAAKAFVEMLREEDMDLYFLFKRKLKEGMEDAVELVKRMLLGFLLHLVGKRPSLFIENGIEVGAKSLLSLISVLLARRKLDCDMLILLLPP
ncbi:hypothetical protein IEQ34_022324 [Dendrobium chrysotoxum]|uniref:Uncharacterized protein n=1 Tax=Dendrobium chrysotoxum TaxID=161865 RepID=A0AAV7FXF6_DENCH|nr:hypothetical protein IEQ34_022324 [Dendrobium chrysotoxum]